MSVALCWEIHKEKEPTPDLDVGGSLIRIAGYVSVCVQVYCVIVFTVSLNVSAYMAIFKCRIFYFHMLEGFCFFFFLPSFTWSHSACFHL
jgi:hypothetical protein